MCSLEMFQATPTALTRKWKRDRGYVYAAIETTPIINPYTLVKMDTVASTLAWQQMRFRMGLKFLLPFQITLH